MVIERSPCDTRLSGFHGSRFRCWLQPNRIARLALDDVAHVINYDLTKMAEGFIHRVGRTDGRAYRAEAINHWSRRGGFGTSQYRAHLKLSIERKQVKESANDRPKSGLGKIPRGRGR